MGRAVSGRQGAVVLFKSSSVMSAGAAVGGGCAWGRGVVNGGASAVAAPVRPRYSQRGRCLPGDVSGSGPERPAETSPR